MRKKELLKKLREYQSWRKGADIPMMPPSEVTRIIDSAITVIEKSDTSKANAVLFKKKVIDKLHITVGHISEETVRKYIENQKNV